jgi:hypothetical protein
MKEVASSGEKQTSRAKRRFNTGSLKQSGKESTLSSNKSFLRRIRGQVAMALPSSWTKSISFLNENK